MVVAPILKGGMIENRWQPISAATWCGPSSRSTSFMAAKIGRSGQPVQKPGGRGGTTSASARACRSSSAGATLDALTAGASTLGIHCLTKAPIASPITVAVYSPAIGNRSLPERAVATAAWENDADLADIAGHEFVEPAFPDELRRRRPARLDLLLLVMERGRRQHDA